MKKITWKTDFSDCSLTEKINQEKIRTLYIVILDGIYETKVAECILVVSPMVAVMLQSLKEFEAESFKYVRENCNRIGKIGKIEVFRDLYAHGNFVKIYDKNEILATIEVILEK